VTTRFSTDVGCEITEMLARSRRTQAWLARRLGLARSSLNQMITGRMRPWPDLVGRSRGALGLVEEKVE
jgi:DNA-binding XRE family transcriptional regulator